MVVKPLPIQETSRLKALIRSELARIGGRLIFERQGLSFSLDVSKGVNRSEVYVLRSTLQVEGIRLNVLIPRRLINNLLEGMEFPTRIKELPPPVVDVMVGAALNSLRSSIAQSFGSGLSVIDYSLVSDPEISENFLDCTMSWKGENYRVCFCLEPDTLDTVLSWMRGLPSQNTIAKESLAAMKGVAKIVLAHQVLSSSDVLSLSSDDILLFDIPWPQKEPHASLWFEHKNLQGGILVRSETSRILKFHVKQWEKVKMNTTNTPTEDWAGNFSSQIPVTVKLVLGQFEMSLSELTHLNSGSVLELEGSLEEPISVYANGLKIGLAELISMDGRLGARITRVVK